MKSHSGFSALIGLLIISVLSTPGRLGAYQVGREEALKNLDATIVKARKEINSPEILSLVMEAYLKPVSDDPRVLAFCNEVVDTSTNSISIIHAIGLVHYIANNPDRWPEIAKIVSKAAENGNERVQIQAYDVLAALGDSEKKKARAGYLRIITLAAPRKGEIDHRLYCIHAIGSLIRLFALDSDERKAIQDATKKLDLMTYYKEHLFNRDSRSAEQSSQRFWDQWVNIVDAKYGMAK